MLRNYLKGAFGNQLNTILAGTGFNLKKMLNRIKEQILFIFFENLNLSKSPFLLIYEYQRNRLLKVWLTNSLMLRFLSGNIIF